MHSVTMQRAAWQDERRIESDPHEPWVVVATSGIQRRFSHLDLANASPQPVDVRKDLPGIKPSVELPHDRLVISAPQDKTEWPLITEHPCAGQEVPGINACRIRTVKRRRGCGSEVPGIRLTGCGDGDCPACLIHVRMQAEPETVVKRLRIGLARMEFSGKPERCPAGGHQHNNTEQAGVSDALNDHFVAIIASPRGYNGSSFGD